MTAPIHVLGFSGSLRKASYNSALLRAAAELLPAGMTLETFDLAPIPLYNPDNDGPDAPESVLRFKERITAADALLIATPEYNYSFSGVLKNAIDWASRPPRASPLSGKPLAIMGAGGMFGTVRAQLHLRQVATECNLLALNKPEVRVPRPWEKFDDQGQLSDEQTRGELRALLEALAAWTRRLRGD
jgi:chromate reductase, NAD(P)H dehydrogenase (quinone)